MEFLVILVVLVLFGFVIYRMRQLDKKTKTSLDDLNDAFSEFRDGEYLDEEELDESEEGHVAE